MKQGYLYKCTATAVIVEMFSSSCMKSLRCPTIWDLPLKNVTIRQIQRNMQHIMIRRSHIDTWYGAHYNVLLGR